MKGAVRECAPLSYQVVAEDDEPAKEVHRLEDKESFQREKDIERLLYGTHGPTEAIAAEGPMGSNKAEWADGMRGIAAVVVTIHHLHACFWGWDAYTKVRTRK